MTSDLDFSGLRYNFTKSTAPILDQFPELKKIEGLKKMKDFYNGIDREAILRYLILMYDPGSPINDVNLMARKSMCAMEAGLPREKNGRFRPEAEKIIMLEDQQFANSVVDFVCLFNSATYSKLVAYNQHYDTLLRAMMTGKDTKIKLSDIDALETSINEMKSRMLRDNSPKLVDALYEKVISDTLKLRPEDIADALQNGENPVDVLPYGEYDFKDRYKWKGTKLKGGTS